MSKGKSRAAKRRDDSRENKAKTRARVTPTARSRAAVTAPKELIFGKENYKWMGIGAGLIALGLALMVGGDMPSPDVWDPNIIYSFRITVLGPFVILAGLVTTIFAIFK